jgi:hypothetical protein
VSETSSTGTTRGDEEVLIALLVRQRKAVVFNMVLPKKKK